MDHIKRISQFKIIKFRTIILSNNRDNKPHGLNGGKAGSSGINKIERKNGKVEELRSTDTVEMKPGDVFVIATPGGGGFGNL